MIAIKSYENQIQELKLEIDRQKDKFEIDKKHIKKNAMNYAIIYYKNKSKELTNIFTSEGIKLLEKYSFLRKNLFEREELLMIASKRMVT